MLEREDRSRGVRMRADLLLPAPAGPGQRGTTDGCGGHGEGSGRDGALSPERGGLGT